MLNYILCLSVSFVVVFFITKCLHCHIFYRLLVITYLNENSKSECLATSQAMQQLTQMVTFVIVVAVFDVKGAHFKVFFFFGKSQKHPVDDRDSTLILPPFYLGLPVGEQRGGGGMAGEAAR